MISSVYRISFALDERGQAVDSSFVKRPTTLLTKNTAPARTANKLSGGPNRNNDVLMEFYLNKVSISILTSICKEAHG